jgi:hypothetical protein
MATLKEFENVMGPLKKAVLEDHMEVRMEVRNEKVSEITYKEWGLDKFTNEKKFQIVVNCHPGKDERYGNRYSGFFAESKADKLFEGLSRDDFKDQNVKVGFEWRDYEKDGQPRKARELKWIKIADVDVNQDLVPEPKDSGASSEQPVLEPQTAPKGISSEKQPPAKGVSRDDAIIRQNTTRTAFEFYGHLVRAQLVQSEDEAIERAMALAHAIEADINR